MSAQPPSAAPRLHQLLAHRPQGDPYGPLLFPLADRCMPTLHTTPLHHLHPHHCITISRRAAAGLGKPALGAQGFRSRPTAADKLKYGGGALWNSAALRAIGPLCMCTAP
jgi:hypothetical protein